MNFSILCFQSKYYFVFNQNIIFSSMDDKEDETSVSLLLDTPSPVADLGDDNDDIDDNTTIEEKSVEHNEEEAMSAEVEEDAKESDSITTATDGCIPTEILEAAVTAALDDLMRQRLSNEESENEEDESGVPNSESMDIEIVGLQSCTNGRSCSLHEVCGDYVEVGDLLRLLPTVVTINGIDQGAIKLVRLMDEADGCTVAFIPRILMDLPRVQNNLTKFCVVKELYRESSNSFKRHKNHRNMGCASCYFLDDIPISE
jgi:hypothetical protein